MNVVEVKDLRKVYRGPFWKRGGEIHALKGVSLSVREGEIFGLLGANGAGKSTLVKILLGIARPTSGEALLAGRPPHRAESRRAVGYQPEDARLPDYHTARSFLRYQGGLAGLSGADLSRRIDAVLARVGLSRRAGSKVREYSKGMRQRLTLAQAMLAGPRILFLDEPTDGLDPVARVEIRDTILAARRDGMTVFINSHLLSEVEAVCDRVMILRNGETAAAGTVAELTVVGQEYQILLSRWDPAWQAGLASLAESCVLASPNEIVVKVPSEGVIDAVVDYLRGRGAGIRGLSRRQATLEQVFLSLVGRDASNPPPR